MSEPRPSFGDFWDTVIDDPLVQRLPDSTTFSPLTVAMAKTRLDAASDETVPPDTTAARTTQDLLSALPAFGEASDLELLGTVLGEGGMGVVLLAEQRSLGRQVAVKTLHPGEVDPTLIEALLQEANLAGALTHPNVVPIHTLGRDQARRPLMVMKRVEGHTWSDLLADPAHEGWTSGRWSGDPLQRHLEILLQVCDAVHFAHDRGVLHRDLKPDNVMVGAHGEVYLMDWGLAVQVSPGPYGPGGSPPYMAPEMLSSEATERTDVYMLGAILHEILTGRRLHTGTNRLGILLSVSRSEPVAFGPEIPPDLGAIANRATHVEPEQRFPSVLELRRAITDYLAHRGSLQLSRAATEILTELRAELAAGAPDAARVERRFAECRFGYRQALHTWPENPGALAGLRDCLDAMIAWELERKATGLAAALLDERLALDPEPSEQLTAWKQQIDALRKDSERVRRLVTDHDTSVARRERTRFFLGIAALILAILIGLGWAIIGDLITPNYGILIALPTIGITIGLVAMVLGRETLLANAFNRRAMYLFLLLMLGTFLHRLVALNLGMGFHQTITTDVSLFAILGCAAGIFVNRWFFPPSVLLAVASVVASLNPGRELAILIPAMTIAVALGGALLYRYGLQEPTEDRPTSSGG